MRVKVLFFGSLRDLLGRQGDDLSLPEGASLNAVLDHYTRETPALTAYLPSIALSVNQQYAARDLQLRDRDEIALLPPVSGGREDAPSGQFSSIVRNKIDVTGLVESMKKPADGASLVFEGIVRNHSRGRETLYLDYEAYEGMALKQMDELVLEAKGKFSIDDARIVHRIGRIDIGETSVVIVVASAHRGPAFEACRFLIDRLKKTVPIWKKEYFADGAVWADGEPFPGEVQHPRSQDPAQATSSD
jgi:molybdopterin synthase catalytic subunit